MKNGRPSTKSPDSLNSWEQWPFRFGSSSFPFYFIAQIPPLLSASTLRFSSSLSFFQLFLLLFILSFGSFYAPLALLSYIYSLHSLLRPTRRPPNSSPLMWTPSRYSFASVLFETPKGNVHHPSLFRCPIAFSSPRGILAISLFTFQPS